MIGPLDEELSAALSRLAHAKRTRDNASLAYASDSSQALGECVTKAEIAFETATIAVLLVWAEWNEVRARPEAPVGCEKCFALQAQLKIATEGFERLRKAASEFASAVDRADRAEMRLKAVDTQEGLAMDRNK